MKEYIDTCNTYHQIKPVRHKSYSILNSILPACGPFINLTMDFITDMPP